MDVLRRTDIQTASRLNSNQQIWIIINLSRKDDSLLVATGTVALLGAMVCVIGATALRDPRLARTRLLKFLPVLLVGVTVQAAWMHRKPAPLDWSVPGYPASYLNQLKGYSLTIVGACASGSQSLGEASEAAGLAVVVQDELEGRSDDLVALDHENAIGIDGVEGVATRAHGILAA